MEPIKPEKEEFNFFYNTKSYDSFYKNLGLYYIVLIIVL